MTIQRLTETSEIYYSRAHIYELFAAAEDAPGKITAILGRLISGRDVLDAGCGSGKYLALLGRSARSYTALDQSPELLKRAGSVSTSIPQAKCVLGQVESLPFPNGSFDLVFSSWVLGTVPDESRRLKAVKEALRVLRPHGKALLVENDCGGQFEALRGRYPDTTDTLKYNEWLEKAGGYKVRERLSTCFSFESVQTARFVFEAIYGAEAAAGIESNEIEHRIVVFEQDAV